MAASTSYSQNPSSSTSPPTPWDVFLSFRGLDTRNTFTGHLYKDLCRNGIKTFKDDPELLSGEIISRALPQAIQESKIYIVVLSENYATSSWCLDELVEILRCYKRNERLVIPVFYYIDPSVVRHQIKSFEKAFEKHQARLDLERVNTWRLTLNEVAGFSGYHISQNRSEADIIDEVVSRILLEINPKTLHVATYLVGLDSRVEGIKALFNSNLEGVNWIGIHGMGGVGKTTLAKAVYNQNYQRFDGSCFLANVREVSKTKGLVCLQQQLINDVLQRKDVHIDSVDQGIELIRERICWKKVLVVIDDLDDPKPLKYLGGSFASGSMVIITTRNEDLLDRNQVKAKYKVNQMDKYESRQLFNQHAFREDNVSQIFTELSDEILENAGGLPLALQVFGSTLLGESEDGWRWFIDKLKRAPIDDVEENLMISFDALKSIDPNLQDIFLDIACFYIGWKKEVVAKLLETCYMFVNRKVDILQKRCLITISDEDKFGMHDLLRDMGRKIARNNCPDEPGKHSRLWVSKDIDTVLKNHKGTEAIQGIISTNFFENRVTFDAESFKRMSKLKFLYLTLYNVNLTGSFEQTFEDLRWLCWLFFPLECLPSEFYAEKLVILELRHSNLRTSWKAPQEFKRLKTLDMSCSAELKTTPDFNRLPCLETLDLSSCSSLEEVHVSIGILVSLVHLDLWNCVKLRSLPDSICSLRALEVLTITGCTRLEALPTELGSIESLKMLKASRLRVSKLPDSIGRLGNLVHLGLSDNENLEALPDSICNLRSLEILDISQCKKLKELPDQLRMITSLKELNFVGDTMLEMLPDISQLSNIKYLDLHGSTNLLYISELPPTLKWINAEDCTSLKKLPDLSSLKQLKSLDLRNCEDLKEIQGLEEVTSLENLNLSNCRSMERLPNLCNLKHFKKLDLSNCHSLIQGLEDLTSLLYLNLRDSGHVLSAISSKLPNLEWIDAKGCTSLKGLQNLFNLKKLRTLDLTNCSGLTEIQGSEELNSLKFIHVAGCTLTKHFFEILSRFGHKVEISMGRNGFRYWISTLPSEFEFVRYFLNRGIQFEIGSRIFLELQPSASHNFLAIILAFEDPHYGIKYSVKNITSGFIWRGTLCNFNENESLIVLVPSSILSIGDGDNRIELKSNQGIVCGIHLLYKKEITMISVEDERSNTLRLFGNTISVEDERSNPLRLFGNTVNVREQRSNPVHSDLGSNRKGYSLGSSSTTVNVGEKRSNPLDNDLESNKNWLSLGNSSTTVNVEENRSYPSERLKHLECDNNWLSL